jgi:hypothetical protein
MSKIRNVLKNIGTLKSVVGIPLEEQRLECNTVLIDEYFQRLETLLKNYPAALVINLDETGHHDFVDATDIKVLGLNEYSKPSINIPVSKDCKRASLLGEITAHGAYSANDHSSK